MKVYALSVGTLILCSYTNVAAVKLNFQDAQHEELELAQADAET